MSGFTFAIWLVAVRLTCMVSLGESLRVTTARPTHTFGSCASNLKVMRLKSFGGTNPCDGFILNSPGRCSLLKWYLQTASNPLITHCRWDIRNTWPYSYPNYHVTVFLNEIPHPRFEKYYLKTISGIAPLRAKWSREFLNRKHVTTTTVGTWEACWHRGWRSWCFETPKFLLQPVGRQLCGLTMMPVAKTYEFCLWRSDLRLDKWLTNSAPHGTKS